MSLSHLHLTLTNPVRIGRAVSSGSGLEVARRENAANVVLCFPGGGAPLGFVEFRVRRSLGRAMEYSVQLVGALEVQFGDGRDMSRHRCLLGWEVVLCCLCVWGEGGAGAESMCVGHPQG